MRKPVTWTIAVLALVGAGCSRSAEDDAGSTDEVATSPAASTTATPTVTEPASTVPASTAAPATTQPATTQAPSTAPATAAPDTTVALNPDAALAASALLTIDDFADGWTEEPYDPESDSDNERTVTLLSECTGLDPNLIGDGVLGDSRVKSGTFVTPDGAAGAQHTVGLAADEATALSAMAAVGDATLPDCYEQVIQQLFDELADSENPADTMPDGLALSSITMERVDLGDSPADQAVWLAAVATFTFGDDTLEQYIDIVFMRQGRALAQLELTGDGAQFPGDLTDPLITLALERLATIA